jgi:hypothetical protein
MVGAGDKVGLEAASDLDLGSPTFRISTQIRKVQGSPRQPARFRRQCANHPSVETPAGIFGGLGSHPQQLATPIHLGFVAGYLRYYMPRIN